MLTVVDGTDAEVNNAPVSVVLTADSVSTDDVLLRLSVVSDFGAGSETIVLVDAPADVASVWDVTPDLSRSDVSDPRADDRDGSLPSSAELLGFSVPESDPEEIEDAFDRGDSAGSDVAPEGDGPGLSTDFAPAAGPESVDPVFADEAPEAAD